MKLKLLLQNHQKPKAKHSLKKNIGDAYLLAHNPVYASIRTHLLNAGFKLSADRFYHYDALPLTELPRILAKKTIPYQDNVGPLAEIEKKAPGVFDLDVVSGLKLNYLLHESAHGIARGLTTRTLMKRGLKKPAPKAKKPAVSKSLKSEQEQVLRIQMEESFANTSECIANIYVKGETHEAFFSRNSYIFKSVVSQTLLIQSAGIYGLELTTRLIFFSYLYSNMIKTEMAEEHFERVLALVYRDDPESFQKISEDDRNFLLGIFRLGLGLDQQFTVVTNSLCLRLMGLKNDLFDLIGFDFLKMFETEPRYLACVDAMVKVITS